MRKKRLKKAPAGQKPIFFLNQEEKKLFQSISQHPENATRLAQIIKAKPEFQAELNNSGLYIAEDGGVYVYLPIIEADLQYLCQRVLSICPENKLEDEMYRPLSNGGKFLAQASKLEKSAFVAVSCLKEQYEYHAAFNNLEAMKECQDLISNIERNLYTTIRTKYDLKENEKIALNNKWEITIL